MFISFSVQERVLAAELVSKIPRSETRDVWLKLGLLSVCHPDLTRGKLFVGCVFSVCLSALLSIVTGDEPRRVAAGDREPFLLSNPDGAPTWKTFHLSCCCCSLSLPSSLSLSVDLKGYNYSGDTERSQSVTPFPPHFSLSGFLLYYFLPLSFSPPLFFWPAFSFLCLSDPSLSSLLPYPLLLIDLSWVSRGKYKSSHCHFKQRDNQTLGCPLTTQGNWPWLWLLAPFSLSLPSCSLLLSLSSPFLPLKHEPPLPP